MEMECVQMTLDDWMEMKRKLQRELLGVKQSFVRIGFALRKIEDGKLYERDGYKSVAEFAKAEYGLEASTVSRFMSINREYSVDGYSEILRPEYEKLGRSQLEEMLKLPESDREMVRPETSREDIRELKRFNREDAEMEGANKSEENAVGEGDEIDRLIADFYKDNASTLLEVRKEWPDGGCQAKRLAEVVNPSGSRSYRKGFFFLMLNEGEVFTKKFGEMPKQMTWEEFARRTEGVLASMEDVPEEREESEGAKKACGTRKDWGDKGVEEPETAAEVPADSSQEPEDEPKGQKTEEKEIAPAQKNAERLEEDGISEEPEKERETRAEGRRGESEEIPGQTTVYDFPKMLPKGYKEAEERQDGEETPEGQQDAEGAEREPEVDGPHGSRKQYLDTLTGYGMAAYVSRAFCEGRGPKVITSYGDWEEWLLQEVDEKGREIEWADGKEEL